MPDDIMSRLISVGLSPGGVEWRAKIVQGDKGPLPTMANALLILGNDPALKGMLAYNEFVGEYVVTRPVPAFQEHAPSLPGPYPRQWGNEDAVLMLGFFQRLWSPKFNKATVEDAMVVSAALNPFHPVRDWLHSISWDGIERIDEWLHIAFGCAKDTYHAAIGSKFLIAAVRRIMHPGCKFDSMLVLEGKQDLGKSTACKKLFSDDWFSDSLPHDLGSKEAAQGLTGKWGIELGELDSLIRTEVETVKAFLSRSTDRFRPPYGKTFIERPRQGVLLGTTNQRDYLRDSTGNRRFWPAFCEFARHEWIAEFREQLWAEAVSREISGEDIWIGRGAVQQDAKTHQADRLAEDVWADKVRLWLSSKTAIRTSEILAECLGLAIDKQNRGSEMRVANVLRSDGWQQHVHRPYKGAKPIREWFAPGAELPGTGGKRVPHVTTSEGEP